MSDRLTPILQRLDEFYAADSNEEPDRDPSSRGDILVAILKDACGIAREVELSGGSDVESVISDVEAIINEAVDFAHNGEDLFDFIPSFAHADDAPLVQDGEQSQMGHGVMESLRPLLLSLLTARGPGLHDLDAIPTLRAPGPWDASKKRHPRTTPLARFSNFAPPWIASTYTPASTAVFEARCEVSSTLSQPPIHALLSSGGACLAVPGLGGYKNRSPTLEYYILDEPDRNDFMKMHFQDVGLSEIAYHSAIDEARKLIFLADSCRVKSYAWGEHGGREIFDEPLPTHTLDSPAEGPLVVLGDGILLRAGTGFASVWKLNTLPTHGQKGNKRIGGKFSVEDSWRDDPENIERSNGSAPNGKVSFDVPAWAPAHWHAHPSASGTMLTASLGNTANYSCLALDMEHGGKTTARYIGHGAEITGFATSAADANVFLTSSGDGFGRLFDVRHPLPALTLDVGALSDSCPIAVLGHPDGVPTVLAGTEKQEQIQVWDLRARAKVYELSTGNNAVNGLAWDAGRNSLYAATECSYVDRNGYHHGYRKAREPKGQRTAREPESGDNEDSDEDDDDYDEDSDDGDEECWPKDAYHGEDYFGYMFDAGDHRIYRYAFKENADISVVPHYGSARLENDDYYF